MKKIDLDRTIIEATVDKALSEIRADPERTIRKLIDMGQGFAKGPFQKHFFDDAQTMMSNEESAYYRLLKRVITEVDLEKLRTFGLNLGYNGCTKGANVIRRREAELRFNIPWALSFILDTGDGCTSALELDRAITQGKELGVYVYLLFYRSNRLEETLRLLDTHDDCAFVLFLNPAYLTPQAINKLQRRQNILLSVTAGQSGTDSTARTLREKRFLFALHTVYHAQDVDVCMTRAHMENVTAYAPLFYFLLAAGDCHAQDIEAMGHRVDEVRNAQRYPVLPIDMMHDMLTIDHVISEDACAVVFDEYGRACDYRGVYQPGGHSIREKPLIDILKASNPKKA